MENINQRIFARNLIKIMDYILVDSELRITDHSDGIFRWIKESYQDLQGVSLTNAFPEFIGLEDQIQSLIGKIEGEIVISKVNRKLPNGEMYFLDFCIEPFDANGSALLLVLYNVTLESQLEQELMQQRNELRLQILARERAEQALREINEQLEERVEIRTAELQDAYKRLQVLSGRLVDAQETERRFIARELHDEVGQALTGLKFLLGMSRKLDNLNAQQKNEEAQEIVDELLDKVRQLSLDLRPSMLDDLGLLPTLLWHIDRFTEQTGIEVKFKHSEIERRFYSRIETAAYRIIQEGLTNIARYAKVTQAQVSIWVWDDALILLIQDQGIGFDLDMVYQKGTSSGLSGMHERANLLDGWLNVDSSIGEGTQISAELPINRGELD